MNTIKKLGLLALLTLIPAIAIASGAGVHLDKAPVDLGDKVSLQRGAKFFASNCLACHAAAAMRFNRLKDIGMTDEEIKQLLPEGGKPGSTMQAAMDANSAKVAFGAAPPDLSVISRSRGPDWLFTFLRSFYVDSTSPSGADNTVFPNVGMPNILAPLQGAQELRVESHAGREVKKLVLVTPGTMTPAEFDTTMGDLTNYLVFMGEPAKLVRYRLGYIVLGFLAIFFVLVYALNKEIWKDIH